MKLPQTTPYDVCLTLYSSTAQTAFLRSPDFMLTYNTVLWIYIIINIIIILFLSQGAGLLGIYGCVLLKEAGYDQVYCSDIDTKRLETVLKFGAIPVLSGNLCLCLNLNAPKKH